MASLGNSIAAMAAKIQDNALLLSSQQTILELYQHEEAEKQAVLDEAQEECGAVRTAYLKAMRARHGVELELWQVRSKRQECSYALDKLQQEIQELRDYKQELQAAWDEVVNDVLVDHQLKREIYRHSVEASIGQREGILQKRSQQLESLSTRMETFRNDHVSIQEGKKRVHKRLEDLKRSEQEEDEELSKTALEVKEMIAKRANLRKALRDHKHAFEEANEATLKWEKECVELAEEAADGL